ncbi:hypothetical protein FIU87_13110 [Bacillus sp. THAF10]|uniref:DUF4085 family protein n=1 Tax=Bacillus sp. THAF10 TaxID=2587848 RepID=UPI001267E01B|nr:DUF4085 family protein [Bacillus sp. THAF10]QFT89593.1 hypothetical protein FIU87_13110 [Bacillus sp. THAF10]
MWNITKEAKERFEKCTLLPIRESAEEWERALEDAKEEGEDLLADLKEELEEAREELLQNLPSQFISYVEDGTLNQPTLPKQVRENYLHWVGEETKKFERVLDAAAEQTQHALTNLETSVQEVFEESLHDATIQCLKRKDNSLQIDINTDGGFSSKALIQFTFEDIIKEEFDEPLQVDQWFIYYELQKVREGFAFRVLFECPKAEWTIVAKNIKAEYFYRPATYQKLKDENKLEETTLEEYLKTLNPDFDYWLITPDVKLPIQLNDIKQLNRESNPFHFIYTNVYEDPYAYLAEPIAKEDLEATALSSELELQVRAWNTMYENPIEHADIINRVLSKIVKTEQNEMLLYVYVNHFYKEGILIEAVIEKYQDDLNC